jgi:protocatechuate 3,4-dioxygenase beta subunit
MAIDQQRRSLMVAAAAAGAGGLLHSSRVLAQAAPACTVTPQQTEGPYFVDAKLQRSDIRADAGGGAPRPGVPLAMSLRLVSVDGSRCVPLAGAVVDVWHCDAAGVYSGVAGNSGNFLRGHQLSDAEGRVRFMTIYPGWYPGRAVHVHFKVRGRSGTGRGYEITSQLYFDEQANDKVFAMAPYSRAGGRVRNERDGGFRAGGGRLMLRLSSAGEGFAGSFDIGVRLG